MNRILFSLFLVYSLSSAIAAETVSIIGSLEEGDRLHNGAPYDVYKVSLKEGQSCKVTIQSKEFDGLLQFMRPNRKMDGKTKIEKDAKPVSVEMRAVAGDAGIFEVWVSKRKVEEPAKYIIQFTSTEQIVDAILRPDGKLVGEAEPPQVMAGGVPNSDSSSAQTKPVRPDRPSPFVKEEAVTVDVKDLGTITIPSVAFIDKSLSQSFGQKEPIDDGSRDMGNATGSPDDKRFVLGKGGSATWQFIDNVMLDREGPDLLIWQAEGNESFEVWVSADGRGFQKVTEVKGDGVIPVDLNGKFSPEEKLTYVKLVDTSLESNRWPGPDIDAIAAVHTGAALGDSGDAVGIKPVEYEDSKGNIHPLMLGEMAFVDESVSHDFGNKTPKLNSQDPDKAVGPLDYTMKNKEEGYFSLGEKGNGVWKFLDNSLVNGAGPDLLIFEIGEYEEPCTVEISEDGKTWITIGKALGKTSALDIGDNAPAGTEFFYVRLTDVGGQGGQWPGADIDAIAAINGRMQFLPLGEESNAVVHSEVIGDAKVDFSANAFVDAVIEKSRNAKQLEMVDAPDGGYDSIGVEGYSIGEFMNNVLVDGVGDDLFIWETKTSSSKVEISLNKKDWVDLTDARTDFAKGYKFDLSKVNTPPGDYRFVKVTDLGDGKGHPGSPGVDIDAIGAAHGKLREIPFVVLTAEANRVKGKLQWTYQGRLEEGDESLGDRFLVSSARLSGKASWVSYRVESTDFSPLINGYMKNDARAVNRKNTFPTDGSLDDKNQGVTFAKSLLDRRTASRMPFVTIGSFSNLNPNRLGDYTITVSGLDEGYNVIELTDSTQESGMQGEGNSGKAGIDAEITLTGVSMRKQANIAGDDFVRFSGTVFQEGRLSTGRRISIPQSGGEGFQIAKDGSMSGEKWRVSTISDGKGSTASSSSVSEMKEIEPVFKVRNIKEGELVFILFGADVQPFETDDLVDLDFVEINVDPTNWSGHGTKIGNPVWDNGGALVNAAKAKLDQPTQMGSRGFIDLNSNHQMGCVLVLANHGGTLLSVCLTVEVGMEKRRSEALFPTFLKNGSNEFGARASARTHDGNEAPYKFQGLGVTSRKRQGSTNSEIRVDMKIENLSK